MVNLEQFPLYRVVKPFVSAQRYGVHIIGTELIGLAPAKARLC